MEVDVNNVVETVDASTDESPDTIINKINSEECARTNQSNVEIKSNTNESEKHSSSAVWTTDSTLTLLKLYETKLEMLETPKKKTRIWIAISENLKEYNIEMSPDQVRWKINALAKKYKHCIDSGQHEKFKYFKEMDNIYSQYNVDCDSYSIQNTVVSQKKINSRISQSPLSTKSNPESKAMVELRKRRLAHRIETERSQSKINLEQQWLEYLRRQEEQKKLKDKMFDRQLRLREEQLELKKRELEMKESLELKKMELKEREQNIMLKIEREKCEMLKKIFAQHV